MTTITPGQLPVHTRDPLAAVLELGWKASRVGLLVGVLVALFGHTMAFAKPMLALHDMFEGVQQLRVELSEYYWATYDIDLAAPEEAKPEEPPRADDPEPAAAEPEPVPDPAQQPLVPPPPSDDTPAPPPPSDDPYDEPPPAAAEAADVMTADDDAVDLSGEGWDIVDKDGSQETGGGQTAKEGTSKEPVYDPRARANGVPGGTGTATAPRPPPPPPPKKNLSRQLAPIHMGVLNNCPYPPQADVAQVDRAVVTVRVTASSQGRPLSAQVVSDPGYGFGAAARRCAMSTGYRPALNADGKAVQSSRAIRFTFKR